MFLDSIVRLLQDEADFEVVGTAGTLAQAYECVAQTDPDVVVLDSRLPDGDGVGAARRFHFGGPRPRVVFVTGFADPLTVRGAIDAGCVAVLSKDYGAHELVSAIRGSFAGNPLTEAKHSSFHADSEEDALSAREIEVLQYLVQDVTDEAVSDRLFISQNSVRSHVARILAKLGATSRVEAVAIACRRGIV